MQNQAEINGSIRAVVVVVVVVEVEADVGCGWDEV